MDEEPPVNGPETPILMVSAANARPESANTAAANAVFEASFVNPIVMSSPE
jgi:hypothetical protein